MKRAGYVLNALEDKKEIEMSKDSLLQRRFEQLTLGVENSAKRHIATFSDDNKKTLADFLHELTYKDNVSPKTKVSYINTLFYLLNDCRGDDGKEKPFKEMATAEVDLYLNGHQRPVGLDPKQRWISTHNLRAALLLKFFKWLYYPDFEPRKKRPKPSVVKNIVIMQKPELTNVEAKHLWLPEHDKVFLKYCEPISLKLCWYHTAADDTSARPSEILAKRFADVKIKFHEGKMFGEVEVGRGGKTKSRVVPLIRSLYYFTQLSARNSDPNSYIFRTERKGFKAKNLPITEVALNNKYAWMKKQYFPSLLERADVPPEDKEVISEMLQKPWNPYIRRHTALTEKAKYLNDYHLRLHAGWSKMSKMPLIYTHELGGESSNEILSKHGFMQSNVNARMDLLAPRFCPKCKAVNKADSKFCVKDGCGAPLGPEAYYEIKESEEAQKKAVADMKKEMAEMKATLKEIKEGKMERE